MLYDIVDEVYTSAPIRALVYLDAYIYYTIVVAVFLSYFSWPRQASPCLAPVSARLVIERRLNILFRPTSKQVKCRITI